jgi:hypothetical protein
LVIGVSAGGAPANPLSGYIFDGLRNDLARLIFPTATTTAKPGRSA